MTSTGRLISEFVDDLYHAFVGYGFLWKSQTLPVKYLQKYDFSQSLDDVAQ